MREAFQLATLKRNSLRDVLKKVTELGLVSQRCTPLHSSGLWWILTNPFYVGTVTYDNEEIQGTYPPLVSPMEFASVHKTMGDHRRHL